MRYFSGQKNTIPGLELMLILAHQKAIFSFLNLKYLILIGVYVQGGSALGRERGLFEYRQITVGIFPRYFDIENIGVYALQLNVTMIAPFA